MVKSKNDGSKKILQNGAGRGMSRVYFSVESEVKSYLKKDLKGSQMEEMSQKSTIKGYK
jgi:hypothetical protein